jgi:hypothetical protein
MRSNKIAVSVGKTTARAVCGIIGCYGENRIPIYGGHFFGLHLPIRLGILEDAEGINPKILYAEFSGDLYCILECLWHALNRYSSLSFQ